MVTQNFFQKKKKNWKLVGPTVISFVKKLWYENELISSISNTLLVLIPKVNKLEFISLFRPVALCNTVYKCLTKLIARKIKPILNNCISPLQVSFVLGRNTQDNIIAHELTHTVRSMKGRKGFM